MTAETSNARGDVVAERQAWYEQQIALAEGQWAAAFLDRWECGDDVPSKEHYVALWLAERAAPQPADAEPKTLPVPTRVYLTDKSAVIVGDPQRGWDEEGPDAHNCDDMGCSTIGPHVLARVPFTDERALSQQPDPKAEARGVVDARRMAVGLWQRHYREVAPEWEPCPDLAGLLSQIDNMVSGLTRAPALAQQPAPQPADAQQGQAVSEDMGGFTSDTAALAFLHLIGNGNTNVERAVERLRQSLIAQQPAAVDEGFVSRLAEALTDQDWDVDPDGDGSGIAQLRAAVVAAQQQGGRDHG